MEEATELLHEERFREALVELRRVLEEDPKNPYAYYFLGIALFEVGEIEAARDAYTACLKLAPRHLGARVALVHVLRMPGRRARRHPRGHGGARRRRRRRRRPLRLGLAYHARGDDAAARKYLEAFLATNPEFEVGRRGPRHCSPTMPGRSPPARDDN